MTGVSPDVIYFAAWFSRFVGGEMAPVVLGLSLFANFCRTDALLVPSYFLCKTGMVPNIRLYMLKGPF